MTSRKSPLCIDLYCGLGGWAEGFLAEGYDVVGFDIEKHDYGFGTYPGQLVLQDVTTLHGRQFKDATVIVASPPCQQYSYRAMPWKRAKALGPPDNTLWDACWRIQLEASETAGRLVPMIVENVRGAQPWVGRARCHYGSYYLWGDVPAVMPIARAKKNCGGSWFAVSHNKVPFQRGDDTKTDAVQRWEGFKDADGKRGLLPTSSKMSSKSRSRKASSALIAKIPFRLARHVAACFKYRFDANNKG